MHVCTNVYAPLTNIYLLSTCEEREGISCCHTDTGLSEGTTLGGMESTLGCSFFEKKNILLIMLLQLSQLSPPLPSSAWYSHSFQQCLPP